MISDQLQIPRPELEEFGQMYLLFKRLVDSALLEINPTTTAEDSKELMFTIRTKFQSPQPPITQNELARRIGINYAQLSRILNSKQDPSVSNIYTLAKFFNLSIFDCFVSTNIFVFDSSVSVDDKNKIRILFDLEMVSWQPYGVLES